MTMIAIESADSIGKDTLIDLIKEKYPNFNFMRFPDERSSSGQLTRDILRRSPNLPPIVLQHLFISNFFENYNSLSYFEHSTQVVIINRYFMSTLAYSLSQGINISHFRTITSILPQPDLWILLEGERRGLSVKDRHDTDHELQLKVMANYRALFRRYPDYNVTTIINDSTPETMLEKFENAMKAII